MPGFRAAPDIENVITAKEGRFTYRVMAYRHLSEEERIAAIWKALQAGEIAEPPPGGTATLLTNIGKQDALGEIATAPAAVGHASRSVERPLTRPRIAVILVGLVIVSAYVAWPYIAMDRLFTAIKTGNVEETRALIDFPSVRASLKDQLNAAMVKQMTDEAKSRDNPFAVLGTMLAATFADAAVDMLMTPDGMARVLAAQKLQLGKDAAVSGVAVESTRLNFDAVQSAWFTTPTRFRAVINDLVLEFKFQNWGWELVEFRIPPSAFEDE